MKKDIARELKKEATRIGLCNKWIEEWGSPDLDELCDKYVKGIDFCVEHDFPSCQYMKEHFDGIMQKHGIFVDESFVLTNPRTLVVNGKCNGKVNVNGYGVSDIYARHDSVLEIIVSGNARVSVETYDNCVLAVKASGNSKVFVYDHGGCIKKEGNVIVKNRKDKKG